MAQAMQVTASAFSRGFARYQDEAFEAEVIEITSHGRVVGGYLNKNELENYRRLKRREVQVLHVSEIDDELLSEIENSQYGVISK